MKERPPVKPNVSGFVFERIEYCCPSCGSLLDYGKNCDSCERKIDWEGCEYRRKDGEQDG